MKLELGLKSDPVEYRYSYEWLFTLLAELGIPNVQLGSSFEFYSVDESYFVDLRKAAASAGVRIRSCFTAHRELGGWFTGDPRLADVARRSYERWIAIGGLLGADFVGSNPGAVYRDRQREKERGSALYLEHLTELMQLAHATGLRGLTIEPMSCAAEPPSLPDELERYASVVAGYRESNPQTTVPVWFCGDISHAVADAAGRVMHDHWELFELEIPYMAEFHLKNTDARYHSTFGFGGANDARGIIDLTELREILERRGDDFPVGTVVAYLEIGGPKLGRDDTDGDLREQIVESIDAIRAVFPELR